MVLLAVEFYRLLYNWAGCNQVAQNNLKEINSFIVFVGRITTVAKN